MDAMNGLHGWMRSSEMATNQIIVSLWIVEKSSSFGLYLWLYYADFCSFVLLSLFSSAFLSPLRAFMLVPLFELLLFNNIIIITLLLAYLNSEWRTREKFIYSVRWLASFFRFPCFLFQYLKAAQIFPECNK